MAPTRQRPFEPPASIACATQPNSGGIKPPTKVFDKRPAYPSTLRGTSTEGTVELEVVIGIDGTVTTTRTLSATNQDFDEAAHEAVRQWRFTPTLLNCVPVQTQR